jgi:hypothetical protein
MYVWMKLLFSSVLKLFSVQITVPYTSLSYITLIQFHIHVLEHRRLHPGVKKLGLLTIYGIHPGQPEVKLKR